LLARKELVGVINLQRYSPREVKLLSSIGVLLGADIGISRLENQNSDLLVELETRKMRSAAIYNGNWAPASTKPS
jgi:uroporphyrinogen-III synthase